METEKRWNGKSFLDWCASDRDDERKLHYTLHIHRNGAWEKQEFTSEDKVCLFTMIMLRASEIREVKRIDDEWYLELEYYCFP